VILYRCFAWNERARSGRPDTAVWFPRPFQGDGRHDNPGLYGCMYLSAEPVSCLVEQLARFRGQRLLPAMLVRRGLRLALAKLELANDAVLVDLDDPAVLRREHLRPSLVATRFRDVTQPQARTLYERHEKAAGLRWWSIFEARWANVTLFDRAGGNLGVVEIRALDLADEAVVEAADVLGLRSA
jgi:hypothetical protein